MRRLLLTLFVGVLAAAPLVLKAAGARLDILQSYAFPLCVFFAVLVGRRRFLRIPLAVPAFALVAWFGCLLYRELSVERKELKALLEITPADHDPLGIRARSLHRKAAIVARTFNIEPPSLIEKSFRTSGEAYSWLRRRGDARLLVVGREENWDLVFGRSAEARSCGESCAGVESEAERYGVRVPDEAQGVVPQFFPGPLLLVQRPELIHVPSLPVDLTAHTLVWLAAGLRAAADRSDAGDALTEDALFEASLVSGPWRSIAPVAAAAAILGTFRLMGENVSLSQYQDGVNSLNRAFRLARKEYDPELYAMIANNLAVARLFRDGSAQSFKETESSLVEASLIIDGDKQPVLGARVAMLNLALLKGLAVARQ